MNSITISLQETFFRDIRYWKQCPNLQSPSIQATLLFTYSWNLNHISKNRREAWKQIKCVNVGKITQFEAYWRSKRMLSINQKRWQPLSDVENPKVCDIKCNSLFLKCYILGAMNEYKILTACKIYLVMVGMAYKKSLKRDGSGKVSGSHFRLFNWIHSPLLLCFIPALSPLSLSIMQTHSLISNSERWLYLRTTERQTIRDLVDLREIRMRIER